MSKKEINYRPNPTKACATSTRKTRRSSITSCRPCATSSRSVGYVEYHASILEPSELYKAKAPKMKKSSASRPTRSYDRGGREVTLRPEMTPTVARMVAARRRELGFPLRLLFYPQRLPLRAPATRTLARALAAQCRSFRLTFALCGRRDYWRRLRRDDSVRR